MKDLLENIYKVIVSPTYAFEDIKKEGNLFGALVIVVFISFFLHVLRFEHTGNIINFGLCLFTLQFSIVFALFVWLITALFFEFLAKVFDKSGNLRAFLKLSAYALVPAIFIAPVSIIKTLGFAGYFFGVLGELLIYLWIVYLTLKALQISYNLKFSRVLFLIAVPFVSWFMLFFWLIGFFADMNYIFKP